MKTQAQIVPIAKAKKKQSVARWTTIGMDLGDQWSHYCVLNEEGEILGAHEKLTTLAQIELT